MKKIRGCFFLCVIQDADVPLQKKPQKRLSLSEERCNMKSSGMC